MKLSLFKTLWGHEGSVDEALDLCKQSHFQGIEAPVPVDTTERAAFFQSLESSGMQWIAEISTCTPAGYYVPSPKHSVQQHLDSLEESVILSKEGSPLFINTMAGYDAWRAADALAFHQGVVELQDKHEIIISVETHRGRSTYSPWLTRDILKQVPDLRITCDFSHWCVVSERLILDEEAEILELAAQHAYHIQPRVGYNQGPQVPDPRAPEFAEALAAHERWWTTVWESMAARGMTNFTMTPEFGPDGYLQCAPFTREPVANLWELNQWIGHRQRDRFHQHFFK
ncbi:MAG: sugar phosphate isomerase/epimerase family protein [Akkermansiaceae bacterium]